MAEYKVSNLSKEMVDVLTPEHDRITCSDLSRVNGYPNSIGYYRCNRCALLNAVDGHEADCMIVEVTVSTKTKAV